jgi:tetratricopeptide (TPR) repeat protein
MAPKNADQRGEALTPQTYAEFYRQGWANHAAGKQETAEEYLRRAVELGPNSIDAHFTLGLALKAQDRRREAVQSFRKVIELIEAGELEDHARSEMVRRLAIGHINQIEKGDWNLEEVVWRKKNTPTEKD